MIKIIKKKYVKCICIIAALIVLCGAFIHSVLNGYIHINGYGASKFEIRGVDVSHFQGEIDWQTIASQNIHFAYIKATEGSSHVDDKFAFNYKNAKSSGLRVGAYHFFSFDSPGKSQAENFTANVYPYENMLPPAADVEFYGDKNTNRPDAASVRRELKDFLDELEATYGMKPVIYANSSVFALYIDGYFNDYPLWIRNVWSAPEKGIDWTFWQYTDKGRLDGFSGPEEYIDLNVFSGSADEWKNFA